MTWFYERNTEFLNSDLNKTFEDVLHMTDDEFRRWCVDLRKEVVRTWDEKGIPPVVGKNKEDIISSMKDLVSGDPHKMLTHDLLDGTDTVIRNTKTELSGVCNSWFPTMMKTKINYSTKKEGNSIYDYFAQDALLGTFVTYASRHFKRDSFYHYSVPISVGDRLEVTGHPHIVSDAETFLAWFKKENIEQYGYGFWFCPVKEKKEYTGYNQELKAKQNLMVHIDQVEAYDVDAKTKTNVDRNRSEHYSIRFYKKDQKLFPLGLKAFRVSFCQYAVNFPPFIARYLYERYTDHIKDQDVINIYDPSSGWSGRLIGAMSVDTRRTIHYIGTDPNTDHNTSPGRTKYHEIADFFNENIREKGRLIKKKHTYDIYQLGSEVIGNDPKFQQYKGKLDFVFTSPPYFSKEQYSDDPAQSCHKFTTYEVWREEFLRPTLTTAVEYLRNDRYLAWNIADVAFDGALLPLEDDSKKILEELGMKYVTTMKMALAAMPGSNRFEETGEEEVEYQNTLFGVKEIRTKKVAGKMKNFAQIESNGKKQLLKYEPIFIFYKP